jgi:hypothetical protein
MHFLSKANDQGVPEKVIDPKVRRMALMRLPQDRCGFGIQAF